MRRFKKGLVVLGERIIQRQILQVTCKEQAHCLRLGTRATWISPNKQLDYNDMLSKFQIDSPGILVGVKSLINRMWRVFKGTRNTKDPPTTKDGGFERERFTCCGVDRHRRKD